jgi:hypothetical protein
MPVEDIWFDQALKVVRTVSGTVRTVTNLKRTSTATGTRKRTQTRA